MPSQAMKTRQIKPAEVRIDELMQAAQALFLEKGIDATTVNEIIEKAGVAKGTFYHYFKSKQQLIDTLKERYIEFFLQELQHAVESCHSEDWEGQFRQWVCCNIQTYINTFEIHDIVYGAHHHERQHPDKKSIIQQLLGILNGGWQAGIWSLKNPETTALLIYSGVHGVADEAIIKQITDTTEFSQLIADLYLTMLKK